MSDRFCITVQHVIELLRTRPIQKWDLSPKKELPQDNCSRTRVSTSRDSSRQRPNPAARSSTRHTCVSVCFTTKATHLEAVSSLTKEACIASLKRFIARRGAPEVIFSDNATNFLGARNDLAGRDESLAHYATMHVMNWVMIPPRAPNFGGLWEAGIKSAKHHLRRVMGNTTLTMEEFSTLLTQIEAILNSRPISPMSSDPNDDASLSPGHFLIGSQLAALPERSYSRKGISPKKIRVS